VINIHLKGGQISPAILAFQPVGQFAAILVNSCQGACWEGELLDLEVSLASITT
jgi:hypothetical protein